MPALLPRDDDYECYQRWDGSVYCTRHSAWNSWIRWVVLAVVIVGFLLLFVLLSCVTARRRRRLGRQPYYGTGWAARPMTGRNNAQPYYNSHVGQPAPPYTAQPQDSYYGANPNYHGQQQGVELQSPPPTHARTGEGDVYAPPPGPPPGKHY